MNNGLKIVLKESQIPAVKDLLWEIKRLNGTLQGKFDIHDFAEPHQKNGKVRRLIEHLDEDASVEVRIGRDYYPGESLETKKGISLRVEYQPKFEKQIAWYNCPHTDQNLELFEKYLGTLQHSN